MVRKKKGHVSRQQNWDLARFSGNLWKEFFAFTKTCSYTSPACPKQSDVKSSKEFMAMPPHARVNLSMFLLLARRSPTIPSFASISKDKGSIPYKKLMYLVLIWKKKKSKDNDEEVVDTYNNLSIISTNLTLYIPFGWQPQILCHFLHKPCKNKRWTASTLKK